MSRRRSRVIAAGIVGAVLLAWDLLLRTGAITFETIPGPTETAAAWIDAISSGGLVRALLHTMKILVQAFVVAVAAGVVLGVCVGLSRTANEYLHGALEFLRFVPPVALIPVVLLISGFSDRTEVVVAAFASVWPVLLSTAGGVAAVDPQLREMGRTLSMTKGQMLVKLVLPAAVPVIAVGVRIAMGLCLVMVVTTEIVAIPRGLGRELVTASNTLQPDLVYAYLLTIGVLGTLANLGFRAFEQGYLRRGWTTEPGA